MSLLEGLPDLASLRLGPPPILHALSRSTVFVLPVSASVSRHPQGSPWFHLDIARHADGRDAFALLDLGLALVYEEVPNGVAVPWRSAFLGLVVEGGPAQDVISAVEVQPIGPAALSAVMRLEASTALLLRGTLVGGSTALVAARLDLVVPGVAPRADAVATFDPRVTIEAVRSAGTPVQLESLLLDPAQAGISTVAAGPSSEPPSVSSALAARLVERFGTLTAPTSSTDPCGLAWPDATSPPSGTFMWDLRQAAPATLTWSVRLDPVASATVLLDGASMDTLVRTSTVPALDVGRRAVTVRSTLPSDIAGVEEIRVQLRLPASPPKRRQAQVRDVIVHPVPAVGHETVVFTPGVGLPFAVARSTSTVHVDAVDPEPLVGPEVVDDGDVVLVTAGDLAVALASVSATDAVLELGDVVGSAVWSAEGLPRSTAFRVDRARPAVSVAVPRSAAGGAVLEVRLVSSDGSSSVALGPRSFGPLAIDLSTFVEVGAHEVRVEWARDPRIELYAIELCTVDEASPTPAAVVSFTPGHEVKTWSYVVTNPLQPGFRHRPFRSAGQAPAPWSAPCSPLDVLHIEAER